MSTPNPDEDSDRNGSFNIDDLQAITPRQTSISFSSRGTASDWHYSEDESHSLGPISPVSDGEDESEQLNSSGKVEEVKSTVTNNDDVQNVPVEVSTKSSSSSKQRSSCNKRNAEGQSALSISSSNCFLEGMQLLIEKGADINLRDRHGRAPLHLAVLNNKADAHHQCVEYLLNKRFATNVNVQDVHGRTPLHVAAEQGCVTCIRMLIHSGAMTDILCKAGETPLHITARIGNIACMSTLSPEVNDGESHSSVESTSASQLFVNDDSVNDNDVLVSTSFYDSPRETMRHHDAVGGSFREQRSFRQNNDSGYFTAYGSAWTKSKYYSRDSIEEVRESSIGSCISDIDVNEQVENESESSSRSTAWVDDSGAKSSLVSQSLEFILNLVVHTFHTLLMFSRHKGGKRTKPDEVDNRFVQPPNHVAEAMEKLILSKQLRSIKHESKKK